MYLDKCMNVFAELTCISVVLCKVYSECMYNV